MTLLRTPLGEDSRDGLTSRLCLLVEVFTLAWEAKDSGRCSEEALQHQLVRGRLASRVVAYRSLKLPFERVNPESSPTRAIL